MEFLPEDIKEIREFFDETQEQFGKRFGLKKATIAAWENDRRHPYGPSIKILKRLAKIAKIKKAA
jgi:DNA-binding transcriptional regulator YiaG